MAQVIVKDGIPSLSNTAQQPQVGVIAGIEEQSRLGRMKKSQLLFHLFDKGIVPRKQPGPAAARELRDQGRSG